MRLLKEYDYKNYDPNGTVGRRPSVRGIIIRDGKLAVVHSKTYDYYSFPGGGIDAGESMEETLVREIREEIGLEVRPETIREYGLVVRKEKGAIDDLFIQENYYFLCDVSDKVLQQKLGTYEIDEDYELCWMDPNEMIRANAENDHGKYSKEEWLHHLFMRDEMLINKLKEEHLIGKEKMAEITYKKLTENELETFIDMRITQLTEEYVSEGREVPKGVDLKAALFDFYHRHMADGTFVSWLALDGDKIVGTSGMSFVEKPPYFSCPTGRLGLLSSMYTDPNYRRLGIAKELLHRVVEEARAYGCGAVHITASNMGVKLYTAYGFKHNGNFMQFNL